MKYKKYIVFCIAYYYPGGGLSDIETSFDTLEEARAFKGCGEVKEIVDRDTWEIIPNS